MYTHSSWTYPSVFKVLNIEDNRTTVPYHLFDLVCPVFLNTIFVSSFEYLYYSALDQILSTLWKSALVYMAKLF